MKARATEACGAREAQTLAGEIGSRRAGGVAHDDARRVGHGVVGEAGGGGQLRMGAALTGQSHDGAVGAEGGALLQHPAFTLGRDHPVGAPGGRISRIGHPLDLAEALESRAHPAGGELQVWRGAAHGGRLGLGSAAHLGEIGFRRARAQGGAPRLGLGGGERRANFGGEQAATAVGGGHYRAFVVDAGRRIGLGRPGNAQYGRGGQRRDVAHSAHDPRRSVPAACKRAL